MIVKALELEQFRNYIRFQAEFHPRVNLIYGENAQGKTNLLEAIAYLSSARSHRARYDREMIRLDGEEAMIRGAVESRRREFLLEARLARGRRRQLFSNGVRLKTAGELSGILNTVLFCPEDLLLIREGPPPGGAFWTAPSASCAPGMHRRWRSTTACMSTRPASSGTGRRTPPCWRRWRILTSAWPRPGRW